MEIPGENLDHFSRSELFCNSSEFVRYLEKKRVEIEIIFGLEEDDLKRLHDFKSEQQCCERERERGRKIDDSLI